MYQLEAVPFHNQECDDILLAKRAGDKLNQQYPGHLWGVNVDSEGGMMFVFAFNISSKWGYKLKLSRVYQDPDLKCVMRAGGEILERAAVARGRLRDDDWTPTFIEGVRRQDQPFNGIII